MWSGYQTFPVLTLSLTTFGYAHLPPLRASNEDLLVASKHCGTCWACHVDIKKQVEQLSNRLARQEEKVIKLHSIDRLAKRAFTCSYNSPVIGVVYHYSRSPIHQPPDTLSIRCGWAFGTRPHEIVDVLPPFYSCFAAGASGSVWERPEAGGRPAGGRTVRIWE